jgi:hypothetical protein
VIPIPTEVAEKLTGSRGHAFRCKIEYNGKDVGNLRLTGGEVRVDMAALVRRTLSGTVGHPDLIPKGAADVLNPTVGALLYPEVGVELERNTRAARIWNSDAAWNTGTHNRTAAQSGDLVIE